MAPPHSDTEILKNILESVHCPESLDSHPWTSRLFVRDVVERSPQLQKERPGQQLIAAIAELFSDTKPSAPPRRGKRLDTRWGEFGILAALYFGPYQFGTPVPNSLREAWGRIDQSILLYVNADEQHPISQNEIDAYKLAGDEPQIAPISTLSDWHCKGIQRLADAISARENYLKNPLVDKSSPKHSSVSPAEIRDKETISSPIRKKRTTLRKAILIGLTLMTLTALSLGALKVQRIYRQLVIVHTDMRQLQQLSSSSPDLKRLAELDAPLAKARQDLDTLLDEVDPLLPLGPWLGWVPVYGGDLAASREILQMADLLLKSTETAYSGTQPLLIAINSESNISLSEIVVLSNQAQPELMEARLVFDQAKQLRTEIDPAELSPQTRAMFEQSIDKLMSKMNDGLAVATTLPGILGAASDGPKTYLLLAQNEDELRPTGGFITAVGRLVVQDGQVLHLSFVDSAELDNWALPYPMAPWQLQHYMNSPVLILRDANWFTDFPTSALYVESLYAYNYSHSVSGVIAFDQHLLVLLLEAMGPIQVEGEINPISAKNVMAYMRSSKIRPSDQPVSADWNRKDFMDKITAAMLGKLFEGKDISWEKFATALLRALNQNHVLLQFDDPTMTEIIARNGWDGALRYKEGDFLMVVDSNIGFNKTNALVETSLSYDVDLTDVESPVAQLTVFHQNNAAPDVECIQWGGQRLDGEEHYPINACYWNYMRVYVPSGAQLLASTPQQIPADWTISDLGVNGQVDVLDEEIDGLQAFGTLMVVPGEKSLNTHLEFALPQHVFARDGKRIGYHLNVEKQPGTIAIPLTIRVHIPHGAVIESLFPEGILEGNHLLIETDLRTDLDLSVNFLLK